MLRGADVPHGGFAGLYDETVSGICCMPTPRSLTLEKTNADLGRDW